MDRINRSMYRDWIFFGYEVNERTINYIIKYITKRDEDNPEFNGKIFTSKRIGIGYINKNTLRRHRYQAKFTEEAEPREVKLRKIINGEANNMEDGVFPTIYTEKKDGVQPEFDIRTDRFEVAINAIDR